MRGPIIKGDMVSALPQSGGFSARADRAGWWWGFSGWPERCLRMGKFQIIFRIKRMVYLHTYPSYIPSANRIKVTSFAGSNLPIIGEFNRLKAISINLDNLPSSKQLNFLVYLFLCHTLPLRVHPVNSGLYADAYLC